MDSVGELLKKAREAQGKSIEEVAKITRMSPSTIEARPRGPNQPMKRTVARLSRVRTSASATGAMRITVRLSTA